MHRLSRLTAGAIFLFAGLLSPAITPRPPDVGLHAAPALAASITVPAPAPGHLQTWPHASDSYLIWTDELSSEDSAVLEGSAAIHGLDLRTNTPITVAAAPGVENQAALSGSVVVWVDFAHSCTTCDGDVVGKDLATGATYSIATGPADQVGVAIAGRTVAWLEAVGATQKILLGDLDGSAPTEIDSVAPANGLVLGYPAISDEYVVWAELNENRSIPSSAPPSRLLAYNRLTHTTQTLASDGYYEYGLQYAVSGHRVVWSDPKLHYADLSTGETADLFPAQAEFPQIFGDTVLWGAGDPNDQDLWGLTLDDRTPFALVNGENNQWLPTVAGDLLAWASGDGVRANRIDTASLAETFGGARAREAALKPQPAPAAGSGVRYFPETQHTLGGRFLAYWDSHGGLAQQGYPLSEPFQEISETDGKIYTVQYFERAVFEAHPENAAPYDVLLSLLGTFTYAQTYGYGGFNPAGAPGQRASKDNPIFFPQTGKTLGGTFRAYWESHGGLAQQGYPISDEFAEHSMLDGKTYTVQYFQRAVFELHPENAGTPYEVLLSQLGREHLGRRYHDPIYAYPSPVPPPPAPSPTPGATITAQDLTSVSMVSADDGWAVGNGGTILHYSGGHWTPVASPVTDNLSSVSMTSATDGWAVGDSGALLHYTGGQWQSATRLNHGPQTAVVMISPAEGWIISSSSDDRILHYTNGAWQRIPVWGGLLALAMTRDDEGWAVGNVILRYSGGKWRDTTPPALEGALTGVDALADGEAWAVTNGPDILHYHGGQWTTTYLPGGGGMLAIRMISPAEGWAVGYYGGILYYADGRWTESASPTTATLGGLALVTPIEGWAVGTGGTILHLQNGTWTLYKP